MKFWQFEEHEDVDEDENEEEMNVSIIHHKQTLLKKEFEFFKIKIYNFLTVPGGILKFAVKTGTSASRLVSSFSPGGTNNELHNRDAAKLLNNNFYIRNYKMMINISLKNELNLINCST